MRLSSAAISTGDTRPLELDYNRVSGNVRLAVWYRSNSCNNDHRRVASRRNASPTDNIARDNVPRYVLRFRSIVASRYVYNLS